MLLIFAALTSCVDKELTADENDVPKEIQNGHSLGFTVTLDKMGGGNATRANHLTASKAKELEEMESYIDVQKFRVLFFAGDNGDEDDDKFLFESTSRWVKKQDGNDGHSSWFVSVPIFGYGNDREYNWDWDKIKTFLGTKKFKIAILANRPDLEWNMGITEKDNPNNPLTDNGWFDNTGPHWKQVHTKWGSKTKKIFDLHHCQYDPIYYGKNWDNTNLVNFGVYDFITGKVEDEDDEHYGLPTMGATSTWVSWEKGKEDNSDATGDTDKDSKGFGLRYWLHPSKDHPIPMYGIQEFNPIPEEEWKNGTIFNLNREATDKGDGDKSISLLRSVVKLELLIPKNVKPTYVTLFFPNIYARCEPMDIWTPTEKIWTDDNDHSGQNCEMYSIMNYGVITDGTEPTTDPKGDRTVADKSIQAYQKKMSWFYGLWRTKAPEWDFGAYLKNNNYANFAKEGPKTPYPQIFNTCIQRNTAVVCDDNVIVDDYDEQYNHWVVYCGERNINDPSNLYRMGQKGSGNPTVIYWMISANGHTYCIPLTDYQNKPSTDTAVKETILVDAKDKDGNGPFPTKPPSTSVMNPYELIVQDGSAQLKPWPLLRNHVYRFTIESIPGTRSARTATKNGSPSTDNFMIKSENLYSKSISFD